MPGETNLITLLSAMEPKLQADEFVFITLSEVDRAAHDIRAICEFREAEGVTLIAARKEAARLGLAYDNPCRMITLQVHSNLAAVGFLAAITAALAKNGISVNVVSAFFHDHLFVPTERCQDALEILKALSKSGVSQRT